MPQNKTKFRFNMQKLIEQLQKENCATYFGGRVSKEGAWAFLICYRFMWETLCIFLQFGSFAFRDCMVER